MKTFLFAWNPKNWDWKTLHENIAKLKKGDRASEGWRVRSHRKVERGDRAFLVRLGVEPKGIMAAGRVVSSPFLDEHWNGEGTMIRYVTIDFDAILDPGDEPLLSLDTLNEKLEEYDWTPQASGMEIPHDIAEGLESLWFSFSGTAKYFDPPMDEQKHHRDGKPFQSCVTRYERNPHARKACIDTHGCSCSVCGFNFEDTFGDLGKGFIHVHHLEQVAAIGKERIIDPTEDLRPVCPNCHAMIHKRKIPYSIEEMKEKLVKSA